MKKIRLILASAKEELSLIEKELGITQAEKLVICEDAKLLAQDSLNGVWLELAMLLINDLEKTIK